ncbi:MAG TPA: winged helix-turn-helix domain-containing protein [Nitrososphaera sp.]|jgi:predicted transcriptional regulator|nr:winged helix-turn-helix domain-containing protein [Nitrososphaera sp.]
MKNRSRYEVIAAILKSVNKEETRTKIMYKAMLSNDQCKLYLDSLIKSGLVQEVNNGDKLLYKITAKGGRFMAYYDQMKELLPVGIEENLADEYYHLST